MARREGFPAAADAGVARCFLDDKVAQAMLFKYNDEDLPPWVLKVRNYVIGVYLDALPLPKWAEDKQHRVTHSTVVPALKESLMNDMDPVLLS